MLLYNLLFKIITMLWTFVNKRRCQLGKGSKIFPSAKILNAQKKKDKIVIGENTIIKGELFVFGHGGSINVGDYCIIEKDSRVWSAGSIFIGNRVLISHNVNIHDNNSHPLDHVERHAHFKEILSNGHPKSGLDLNEKPIIINDDSWIGFNAVILKGVSIGRGAIVAANSLVTKNVPPFTVVAGNPARVIKKVGN